MTWKRVATAVVLIPFVVGLVLWGSTAWVALVLALIIVLALFEYFALGMPSAIAPIASGPRLARFCLCMCSGRGD